MASQREDTSINRHFYRDGVTPAVMTVLIMVITVVMTFVGPWLFEHFR